MKISVIIPALNEATVIDSTLACLQALRKNGGEVILVDGGSDDETLSVAGPLVDRIVTGVRGRARQMNAGASGARGDLLWFVHADTRVPAEALVGIGEIARLQEACWGRFDVRLDSHSPLLRVVERMMNLRSCLTGVCTGDQGIFVSREWFVAIGGFADIPLMEDVELSKRLRKTHKPECLRNALLTSARRWEQNGVIRTIVLMWFLRAAYYFGISPVRLARWYR